VEGVVGRSVSPTHLRIVCVADEDADTPSFERLEGVLVRDIVTQVDRYYIS
jgi:hypothetical protein